MKIGIISDTHDHFDSRLPVLFAGVAHILHAGDIGQRAVLDRLERIAPVTAVLGNNDSQTDLQEFETLELAGRKFLLHHIVHPDSPSVALQRRLLRDQPEIVIGGHTHQAAWLTVERACLFSPEMERNRKTARVAAGQIWFLNPGYAGRPRFGYPRSVAILHCEDGQFRPQFLNL